MNTDLRREIRQAVADVFAVDAASVTDESSSENLPAWDSIGHLNLILSIEQQFGVSFDPNQIPKLTSVAALAEAVASARG